MPETNNQIEGSTLTNDQELYEHLNFSEEEIETDQQQKIGERIDVNNHILLDGMISNHQNEFSKLPDDIKIPSEKIRNIHDDNPMNKLLCLHQGKLYYIENLDPQKGEKKAYVIAEEVWYGNKRLFQASIQHNINQTLINFAKTTKNKKNGTRTLLASPSLVYNIIKNNEIFENAKETQGIARTVAQPDPTYIGERLKIGIPKYGTRDPEMKVQLMLHEDKLYQIDRQNKQSKLLADNVKFQYGTIYKTNEQGLRMVLFSPNTLKESHNIGLIRLTTPAKASHEPGTSHSIQDSKSLEDLTKYKQLLPEPSTSNIAQDGNSLSNLIDLTTSAKASPKLNRNTQSNTLGHTQKRPAPQRHQKGSNEDLSR